MAGHVAKGTGTEIPPAPPLERVIGRMVRSVGRRSEELVPFDGGRHGRRVGGSGADFGGLRPYGTVSPGVDLAHRPDRPGLNDLDAAAEAVGGGALVAHLGGDLVLSG